MPKIVFLVPTALGSPRGEGEALESVFVILSFEDVYMLRQGVALLKAAWDLGINTFDMANAYSNGVSESVFGEFLTKVRSHYV